MSTQRTIGPAHTARETALEPSPGFDALWLNPLVGRVLGRQRRLRGLDERHPWLWDTAVVLAIALVSLPDLLNGGEAGPLGQAGSRGQVPTAVPYLIAAALIAPLWWRRRAPAASFVAISAVSLVGWSLGLWLHANVSTLVVLYNFARHGSLRWLRWAVALACLELIVAVAFLVPATQPFLGLFFLIGLVAAAVATGLTLRIRQLYLAGLEERAEQLEVEREQRVRLTAAAERSRVAREMHDIVGHNLSVMVGLADGAAVLAAAREEQSTEVLRLLGDTGRQAMDELRRVLGVLREDPAETRTLSPQPGIGDLDALLSRIRAAGLAVTYRTVGDLEALGSGVQLTVYRIVQEALTNTLKHAGTGSSAEVSVSAEDGSVRVRVADTGPRPEGAVRMNPGGGESGHGLVGIRQRAAMYGGTATIGPRNSGHGWMVDIEFEAPSSSTPPGPGE